MWRSSYVVVCAKLCTFLLLVLLAKSVTNASVIPVLSDIEPKHAAEGQDQHYHYTNQLSSEIQMESLPNSLALISPEALFTSFENGTSLFPGSMQKRFHRVKRYTCKGKERPDKEEVLVYENLNLPNRCWEDCDCMPGRYCTRHSWCHDLPRPTHPTSGKL